MFVLHPSNSAQSQFEWRSTIDSTKTKRSNGSSFVTVSISHSLGVPCWPVSQRSRFWPYRADAGETVSIAFLIRQRFTQDRIHSLNTACSSKAFLIVETKHCSDSS